jgi:hypothetical protein
MKKRFSILFAVFAFFAMTAVSFAANTVTLNITSEPLRQFSPCDKAGGIVGSFDVGTEFKGGDILYFDLDFGITLCKDIDFEAGFAPIANHPHVLPIGYGQPVYPLPAIGVRGTPGTVFENFALAPFHGSLGTAIQNLSSTEGVFFRVTGTEGSARVNIQVMTYDGTTYGTDPLIFARVINTGGSDPAAVKMTFAFLDGAIYDNSNDTGLWMPDVFGNYQEKLDTVPEIEFNTLCINVSQAPATKYTFNGNFDSTPDKYTFLPSNPQIAHVAAANNFVFEECKDRNIGRTICPGSAGQGQTVECPVIDNESYHGYCTNIISDKHVNNNMIIRSANLSPFDLISYKVTLEILVDGVVGNYGAYWSNVPVMTEGYATKDEACDADDTDGSGIGAATYYDVNGTIRSALAPTTGCSIPDANKVVKLVTTGHGLNLNATDRYLYVNLPTIITDGTLSGALSVRVSLDKFPCGTVFSGIWEISEDACCLPNATTGSAMYPYFAKLTGDFVNVIIVDNVGSTDGTCDIMINEEDGDQWKVTGIPVQAGRMFVAPLTGLTPVAVKTVDGVYGNSRSWAQVEANFAVDGSAWIVKAATGESFGYIARLLMSGSM